MEPRGQVVKAMALIRRPRDGALLVSEGSNPSGERFHRPLGGHVEFGEYAAHTVCREFGEEIGQDLQDVRLAGVLENIFEWDGGRQHEIVFVFLADFADVHAYEIAEQHVRDAQKATRVIWRPQSAEYPPFYPLGVDTLARSAT
ncbi:MAG: NUDIX hydrolase [Streptosporangiaceae bacterium]